MTPDPTSSISLDYVIEFSDDGAHPEPAETKVILIPPPAADAPPNQMDVPEQGLQDWQGDISDA